MYFGVLPESVGKIVISECYLPIVHVLCCLDHKGNTFVVETSKILRNVLAGKIIIAFYWTIEKVE